MQITFKLEKETKGTYRFKEEGATPKVGTLYVKKTAFPKGAPETLTVTIEES